MTDAKLKNGDIAADSTGRLLTASDYDAVFQSAMIRINSRLGAFVYDRTLGSRLDFTKAVDRDKAELLINEALADFENTYARVLEVGTTIKIELTINDERRTEEVRLSGNV